MSNLAYIDDSKIWTYADVKRLDDDNRYEIVNGKLYMLASPSTRHQGISFEISYQIANFFKGKTCQPFYAPMDIDIEQKGDEATCLVQPDVFVVCDINKIGENNIIGAPDFIIEILSPSSTKKDNIEKFTLYEKYKVKEYWVVNPSKKEIQIFLLKDEKFVDKGLHSFKDSIESNIFHGLKIELKDIYYNKCLFIREETEEYKDINEKIKKASHKYANYYNLGKYEKQVLQYILSLKETWDYEDDVMELGAFRKLFELFDGNLVYRGYNIIHFK